MKNNLTEARLQFLAGVINENEFKQLNEETDATSVYDSAIKDAIESFAEENNEEGNIESPADIISLMGNDKMLANDVFNRAFEYVKFSLPTANEEDFKQWFNDTTSELN